MRSCRRKYDAIFGFLVRKIMEQDKALGFPCISKNAKISIPI